MANIGAMLKEEISRLARKTLNAELEGLRKASAGYRKDIAALKRQVAALERGRAALEKRVGRTAPEPGKTEGESNVRFSAKGLKTLRARLGLSAEDFGRLAGVSGQSIYNWERGTTVPRRQQVLALAGLRGLGKREAVARLEAKE